MAELAIPALIASTALTATSQVMKGQEESKAARFEQEQLLTQQEQYRAQEEAQRTAANQAETRRRDELVSNLETIQAIRSGRGVGLSSPTGMAILDNVTNTSERDIGTERLNYMEKADASRIAGNYAGGAASMAGSKARMSLLSGYMGAGATVSDAAFRYGNIQKYGTASPRRGY